jgi:hypothetical protein
MTSDQAMRLQQHIKDCAQQAAEELDIDPADFNIELRVRLEPIISGPITMKMVEQ